MISILLLSLSLIKLMIEDSLLIILMTMEMVSMLSFFFLLSVNPQVMSLTSCTVTILTVMISESVLSLTLFIGLLRSSSSDKIYSLSLTH